MGGSSGSSGIPSNNSSQAVAYQPTAQAGADTFYQNLLGGFAGALGPDVSNAFSQAFGQPAIQNAFAGTPGGVSYNLASPFVGGTGSGTLTDPNNPYYAMALTGGLGAAGTSQNVLGSANLLGQLGSGGTATSLDVLSPLVSGMSSLGPQASAGYLTPALGSLGALLTPLTNQATNQSAQIANGLVTPGLGSLGALQTPITNQAIDESGTLNQYGNQVLNTAFDPQSALYNQLQNQASQQANAANAAAGLGGSAYGASNTANALNNFNINWQNQQLARQAQGLSAAEPAFSEASSLPESTLNAFGQAGQTFGNLGSVANNLPYQSLGLAGQVAQGIGAAGSDYANLGGQLSALGFAPAQGYGQIAGQVAPLASASATLAGTPYNTQSTNTQNALSALTNYSNIGNQQFAIPQQVANDLQSYLQLGQAASGLSGQLGAMGQQELGNSLAGIGSAVGTGSNLLFGNSLASSGGLLGLSGLGGGAAAAGLPSDAAISAAGGLDIGSTGLAGAATDASLAGGASAGGGGLASLLPFGAAS